MKHWWIGIISEQPCWPQVQGEHEEEAECWNKKVEGEGHAKLPPISKVSREYPSGVKILSQLLCFWRVMIRSTPKVSTPSHAAQRWSKSASHPFNWNFKFLKLPVLSSLSRNEVFLLREVPEPLQLHHGRGSQLHGGPHPRPCRQTHQQYPNKEAESTKRLVQSKEKTNKAKDQSK